MTHRIHRLKAALFQNSREISLERAMLYTASHQQTEGEPVILRRAKATAYILEHVEISIRDEELIAGNRTVKPRAGIMSPEMDPYWLLNELDQFPTRPQDRFDISETINASIVMCCSLTGKNGSMKDFINGQMTDEVKAAVSTQIFSINQTDKGQGHIIIDYPRLLNHGLGELVMEMRAHCEQAPDNAFYQAALLLLEASQRHILRYAVLAEEMAERCPDVTRRQELLTIAANSRHNVQHKPAHLLAGVPVVLVHEHHFAVRVQRQFAVAGAFRSVHAAVLSGVADAGRRSRIPERTAGIAVGEMQRHCAPAFDQQRTLFRWLPDRLYRRYLAA